MSLWHRFSRGLRKAATATALLPGANDYKATWNYEARLDAQDAVLTGSTRETFESTAKRDAERILEHLGRGKDAVVLNIGCGIGRVDLYLAPHVRELWAIDVSSEMLTRAQERLRGCPNIRFLEVGNRDFLAAFADGTMDLVFSYLVLQHLEKADAVKYLREAARVLKPGGIVVTQFPNYLSPEYENVLLVESDVVDRSPGRVRPYTEAEVRRTLAVLGFESVALSIEGGREGTAEIYVTAKTPS